MQGRTRQLAGTAMMLALAIIFQSQAMGSDNKLVLRKGTGNTITVDLANKDGVAGAQFSITAQGGLILRSFEPSERLLSAGVAVYQSLVGKSTLNIVLLAPVRSFLPSGEGVIGEVSFTQVAGSLQDSAHVILQRVVLCDVAAKSLDVSTFDANWTLNNCSQGSDRRIVLEQNYPNPFNPSTTISYQLRNAAHVQLAVYDIAGRMVNLLVNEERSAGQYSVRWDVTAGRSAQLASGLYFARFNVDGEVAVMKMMLTK